MTEEQKKAKLEELRQKLAEKRANQSAADLEAVKKNEVRAHPALCVRRPRTGFP